MPSSPPGTTVLRNRLLKSVTEVMSQAEMSPENPEFQNMPDMSVTEPVSHAAMSPSKDDAPLNMSRISVTEPTFQTPMGWLNAVAPAKVWFMSVTSPTSHIEMSVLIPEPWNVPYMSVTLLTSHVPNPAPVNAVVPLNALVRSATPTVDHPVTSALKELASRKALERSLVPERSGSSEAVPERLAAP